MRIFWKILLHILRGFRILKISSQLLSFLNITLQNDIRLLMCVVFVSTETSTCLSVCLRGDSSKPITSNITFSWPKISFICIYPWCDHCPGKSWIFDFVLENLGFSLIFYQMSWISLIIDM